MASHLVVIRNTDVPKQYLTDTHQSIPPNLKASREMTSITGWNQGSIRGEATNETPEGTLSEYKCGSL